MTSVAIVVSYNRADLLKECLDGLAAQTTPLERVIVIDNGSTDHAVEIARNHPVDADVHELADNLGGAGGFAAGVAWALDAYDPTWVWLMDDDTIPTPHAHEGLLNAAEEYPNQSNRPLQVLSSRAVWTDGRLHPMNTPRVRLGASSIERSDAIAVESHPIRTASFVAAFLSASACRELGLPLADYFIWGDDTHYTGSLLREGVGIQVHTSIVEHRTAQFASWKNDPGPRFYYDVRNKLWVYVKSDAFRWWERTVYLASAVKGWVATVLRSSNRSVLLRHALRGLRDGLFARPRPTSAVLSGNGAISAAVERVESSAVGTRTSR